MKLNRLETHDRFKHFTGESFSITECCEDIIKQKPFGNRNFYIFAHARTDDDGVTKRMIWQPRLTKPKAQTNSMLFKTCMSVTHSIPMLNTSQIRVIWIIPAPELWAQFRFGTMTHNQTVLDSINAFNHDRRRLERKEDDDLDDETIDQIYREIAQEARSKNQ